MPLFFWLPMIVLSGMAKVFEAETARVLAATAPRDRSVGGER
jgi:hypothetical protein